MSEGNGFATRQDFLARCGKRRFDEFEVPEFGKVRVRSLTEGERCQLEADQFDEKGRLNKAVTVEIQRRWLVACVVDGEGNQVLTPEDVKTLDEFDSGVSEAIFRRIRRLNRLDEETSQGN